MATVTKELLRDGIVSTDTYMYLGNIHGTHIHDGYAGAVFDIQGVSPALTTCQGGGRQPHIIIYEREHNEKDR